MHVRVRLFARQREIAGTREVTVELPEGSTIEDAWAALVVLHPALATGRPYVRYARNGRYTDAKAALEEDDEVACIPPVAGGAEDEGEPAGPEPDPGAGARAPPARPGPRARRPPGDRRPTVPW